MLFLVSKAHPRKTCRRGNVTSHFAP